MWTIRSGAVGAGWGDVAKRSASERRPAPAAPERVSLAENKNATEVAFLASGQFRSLDLGLAAIVKEDLAINQYIKYITFNPAKRDKDVNSNARQNMYMKYIQGRLPNAKQIEDPSYPILIKIK